MLAVGSRLPPYDWARGDLGVGTRESTALAVALHVSLLEIRWEAVEILVVWKDGMALASEEVVVPHSQDCEEDGHVLGERSRLEVLIHLVCTLEKFFKRFHTNCKSDRSPDSTPEGVSSSHPVPEAKHVLLRDAEARHSCCVCGESHEMLCHRFFITVVLAENPLLSGGSIEHGLLCCERFGAHEEKSSLWIHFLERLSDVSAVHVAHKVNPHLGCVRPQGFCHHDRTKIRSSDADVHHICERLPAVPLPLPAPHLLNKLLHLLQHRMHIGHHVLPVHQDRLLQLVAESDMEDRSSFSGIDGGTSKHLVSSFTNTSFTGKAS
mmetsp:Transcript_824/g.1772  ORF Transcript_824/g.1772 Transcript_824/m.1772 type:complete len:322 (+) Transcript_824:560-1525(+)